MSMAREIMHCKPGKAKELVKLFKQVVPLMKEYGIENVRIYTDVSGESYWTVVIEQDVKSVDDLSEGMRRSQTDPRIAGGLNGYHDLVIEGRRELFRVE